MGKSPLCEQQVVQCASTLIRYTLILSRIIGRKLMDELAKLLKDMVTDAHKQDVALLELCKVIIDRLVELEAIVDVMQKGMVIQNQTIRTHTDTMKVIRTLLDTYTEKKVH